MVISHVLSQTHTVDAHKRSEGTSDESQPIAVQFTFVAEEAPQLGEQQSHID